MDLNDPAGDLSNAEEPGLVDTPVEALSQIAAAALTLLGDLLGLRDAARGVSGIRGLVASD